MDDDTYFVMGTPQELIPKVQALTENVHAGFSSRGLNMNFGDFKCAAVATFRGVGSKKARVELHIDSQSHIPLQLAGNRAATLHAAMRYAHLGGIIAEGGKLLPEVKSRSAKGTVAYHKCRKQVLANPDVPTPLRCNMLDSLVCSGMLYNAATWSQPEPAAVKAMHYAIMRMYRMVAGKAYAVTAQRVIADTHVAASISRPMPADMLRITRLRYFGRLILHGPQPLRALIQATANAPRSWLAMIKEDLAWMANHVHLLAELRGAELHKWQEFVIARPQLWETYVKRAMKAAAEANKRSAQRHELL